MVNNKDKISPRVGNASPKMSVAVITPRNNHFSRGHHRSVTGQAMGARANSVTNYGNASIEGSKRIQSGRKADRPIFNGGAYQ